MVYSKKNDLLTEDVFFILETLEYNGYKSRIVGGAVRNLLMGKKDISDIDIATTATPNAIQNIFKKLNIDAIPTGIKYGTITIIYKKKSYEITTLRKDIKTFGRHAEVIFTKSFKIDSTRRDFTINAIYMDKNGKLFDYHNGISDIQEKNIRFIGNPANRIQEDYLRIFRYFRFVSYYGNFKLNEEYLSVIYSFKKSIHILSIERILSELLLMFKLKNIYKIIPFMKPIIDELFDLEYDALSICNKIHIKEIRALDKFCMMLKFSNFSTNELLKKYCFPKKIKQRLFLKCSQNDMKNIKQNLKTIRKDLRLFFIQYILVKMYINKLIRKSDVYRIKEELISFCNSEYIDFELKASDLTNFKLSKQKLEEVMLKTKQFWKKSSFVSKKDCLLYAINIIKRYKSIALFMHAIIINYSF